MKIGVAITTIHRPTSLPLLQKLAANLDVRFFIACDRKTPSEIVSFVDANTKLLTEDMQGDWKCSEALTWNSMARRNIAFLEAAKWGSDIVIAHDVDNYPMTPDYFNRFAWATGHPFSGIKVCGDGHWLDPGQLLIPAAKQRGYPHGKSSSKTALPIVGAKVGVVSGLVLGDPDVDSVTRMERHPDVGSVHIFGSTGIVVDPHTWTIFNTQNSGVVRDLLPSWFLMPGVGRMDDIYGSLVVQRVARERGYHVHLGQPFVFQQRHEHDAVADLRAEIDGMENVEKLADLLDSIILPARSVIEDTRIIYEQLCHCSFIPEASAYAGLVWLEDCEGVM